MRILIVSTAHNELGETGIATGVWFEELTTPYYVFLDSGHKVDIATIRGGPIPVDPKSYAKGGKNPPSVERFVADPGAMALFEASRSIDYLDEADYQAIFVPGGHGAMWDLASDAALPGFLTAAWSAGLILSSVCHGPASFVNVRDAAGKPLVSGKKVNCFSDSEERQMKLENVVPFLLESRLRELGAHYQKGPDFGPYAVRDGRLITGQNPDSAGLVAKLVLEAGAGG
jgi:putative intracellular protease/amidase